MAGTSCLPRGNAGQAGNLKTISFATPVFVDASTIALLTGQADAGENLRIDKLTFTRVASPELPPSAVVLDPAAIDENIVAGVIGTLGVGAIGLAWFLGRRRNQGI